MFLSFIAAFLLVGSSVARADQGVHWHVENRFRLWDVNGGDSGKLEAILLSLSKTKSKDGIYGSLLSYLATEN